MEYLREQPPPELLRPCPPVAYTGDGTNGSVLQYIADLRSALRSCDNDKTALQQWAKDLP